MNTILLITDADLTSIHFLAKIGEIVIITNRVIDHLLQLIAMLNVLKLQISLLELLICRR